MAKFIVTRVRKELSSDGTHQHIEGVCVASGLHYSRRDVVASIAAGNIWVTSGGGREARIKPMPHCPRCDAAPYITTAPDHTTANNLEFLPLC